MPQQRPANVVQIGLLTRKTDASVASQIDAFRQSLKDLGWVANGRLRRCLPIFQW